MNKTKSVVCAIVKDEQRFVREWVEWYLNNGFDKLYIYEDYTSTSHEEQLQDYIASGKVELTPLKNTTIKISDYTGTNVQKTLYLWFLDQCQQGIIDADWVGFFDVDEFIDFEPGWNLQKLEESLKDEPGVLLSWVMYGANGHEKRPDGSVVDNYTSHLPLTWINMKPKWSVKSLVNVHKCKCEYDVVIHVFSGLKHTDGSGVDDNLSFEKAWLRHYFTKSFEDYKNRVFARGNMSNNFRCFDLFFKISPEFLPRKKEMISKIRNQHAVSTMWISRELKIISGGNQQILEKLQSDYNKKNHY